MKKEPTPPTHLPKSSPARYLTASTVAAACLSLAALTATADDATSRMHTVVNFEFADMYLTPRGMMVTDKGLTFQPLVIGLANVYKDDGFINDLTLVGGFWNDFSTSPVSIHGPYGSQPKTTWVEMDPIAGISLGFAKNFKLDVTYTAFCMQVLDIGTSQHIETKLSYNDSQYLGAFALNPYVSVWQELAGKATDAALPGGVIKLPPVNPHAKNPAPGSSHYFDLGIDPGYTFNEVLGGLKIEAPCRMLLPDRRFYGDFYASSSTIGLVEAGLKATVPIKFVPEGYGHWSFHAGFKEMYFVDNNLYNLNAFNAPGRPTRDVIQVYAGINIFF